MNKIVLLLTILLLGCSSKKKKITLEKEVAHINYNTFLYYDLMDVNPKHLKKVLWIASIIKQNPEKNYLFRVHSNTIELKKDSLIGKKRLKRIENILIKEGVNRKQFIQKDLKDEYHMYTEKTEEGRANNRIIEVVENRQKD